MSLMAIRAFAVISCFFFFSYARPSTGGWPDVLDDALCAMQLSLKAQTGGDCASQAMKMPDERHIITNNLGGAGPDAGPPVLHISPMIIDEAHGRSIDLIISNLTEYSPANSTKNGFFFGDFVSINILAGYVDLMFTFKETQTGADVAMPGFNFTIYDIDGPNGKEDAETVSIPTAALKSYMITGTSEVAVAQNVDVIEFQSTGFGNKCDNPVSMEELGLVDCKGVVVDQFSRAAAIEMKGGVENYPITLRVRDDVSKGRNFFFGMPAYFEKVCHAGPTSSPTPIPTLHPTPAPTKKPTLPPTAAPTKRPTSSSTLVPSAAPTLHPTASLTLTPTTSPTSSPTRNPSSDLATEYGDPHVGNVRGDRFEILQPGYHYLLVVPRGAAEGSSLLRVRAKVEPLGPMCTGLLYVTTLVFKGKWLAETGSLEFSANINGGMDPQKAIKIRAGGSSQPYLNLQQFRKKANQTLADVQVLAPKSAPKVLNKHVNTLLIKLRLGPSIARVRMVYQKEKTGFSNSLWLTTTGLRHVKAHIGGILGIDDHAKAASRPKQCLGHKSDTMRSGVSEGRIQAWSSFEDSEKK